MRAGPPTVAGSLGVQNPRPELPYLGTSSDARGSSVKDRGEIMSTWFRDDANPQLLEAKQIAWEFLERSGEMGGQSVPDRQDRANDRTGSAKQAGAFEPGDNGL